jgi:hypothetical protein
MWRWIRRRRRVQSVSPAHVRSLGAVISRHARKVGDQGPSDQGAEQLAESPPGREERKSPLRTNDQASEKKSVKRRVFRQKESKKPFYLISPRRSLQVNRTVDGQVPTNAKAHTRDQSADGREAIRTTGSDAEHTADEQGDVEREAAADEIGEDAPY